ncbi:helix-turn-helix domain-containing protein [Ornithinimicrobium cryptoxanthini]|uniref:helix-turn-helix domain-containing protein n=1 Tax=Ornithinimicrobium cryptoxanthini TaxID=2934161 RepID=UPI002118EBC1|nr:AraC family transcriptional regulator [Ornithinimicrobium cryptoxanthini]
MAEPPHAVDKARLTERATLAPPVHRYPPAERLQPLVRYYWVPVWDLPEGTDVVEQVLQYPTCLLVIAGDYARFYGVARGLSTVTLSGRGWAVGVMLQPGAGTAVAARDVSGLVDSHVDLAELEQLAPVVPRVRELRGSDSTASSRHAQAIAEVDRCLEAALPLNAEAELLNRVVQVVESDPDLLTVAALATQFSITERTLQRLTERHLGLTPKWLIQRRRLHEAVHHLKHGTQTLAGLAADLGYTDQAHFTRDFSRVTGRTPGQFARTLGRDAPADG